MKNRRTINFHVQKQNFCVPSSLLFRNGSCYNTNLYSVPRIVVVKSPLDQSSRTKLIVQSGILIKSCGTFFLYPYSHDFIMYTVLILIQQKQSHTQKKNNIIFMWSIYWEICRILKACHVHIIMIIHISIYIKQNVEIN